MIKKAGTEGGKAAQNIFNSLAVIKIPKMFLYLVKNKKLWKRNSNFGTL